MNHVRLDTQTDETQYRIEWIELTRDGYRPRSAAPATESAARRQYESLCAIAAIDGHVSAVVLLTRRVTSWREIA